MKKISLQWRLTILTTVLITVLCGCLTFFLYKNGVYYIDTLQETVTDQSAAPEAVYIDIPDNEWDDFAAQFATKVYNSKSDYRNRSLLITVVVALIGGAVTFFVSGRALKPLKEFSETVEKVQAQNLADYTIEENRIAELDRLRTSYNKMLMRLSESFETQRQFTGNASGEIDPAIIPFLMEKENMNAQQIDDYLNRRSGILGISGLSSDFRDLESAANRGDERSQLAIDIFAYKVKKYIGGYVAAMGGVDAIIFTAGLGENSPFMRDKICNGLEYLGTRIDPELNKLRGKQMEISIKRARVKIFVIPTNEELVIARDTLNICRRIIKL